MSEFQRWSIPLCFARVTPVHHKQSGFNSARAKWNTILVSTLSSKKPRGNNDLLLCRNISNTISLTVRVAGTAYTSVIAQNIYIEIHILLIVGGNLCLPQRTHHGGWFLQREAALPANIHDSDFKGDGVCVVGNLQSEITRIESAECFASMAVYNWSEITCRPYRQHLQVLRQGHEWWTLRLFRFSRKVRLFFLNTQMYQGNCDSFF